MLFDTNVTEAFAMSLVRVLIDDLRDVSVDGYGFLGKSITYYGQDDLCHVSFDTDGSVYYIQYISE